MICPHCHTENRAGAKFCDECGTRLTLDTAAPAHDESAKLSNLPDIAATGYGMSVRPDAFSFEPVDEFNDEEPIAQQEIADEIDDRVDDDADDSYADDEVVPDVEAAADADGEEEPEPEISEADGALDGTAQIAVAEVVSEDADTSETDAEPVEPILLDDAQEPEEDDSNADIEELSAGRTHVLNIPELKTVALEAEKTQAIGPAQRSGKAVDPDVTADLSGFDEYLVNPGYVPPKSAWQAGDTMEMPRIDGMEPPKQKDFKAPDPNKKSGRGKKIAAAIALVLVIAAAIAAGATYYLEIWGGKVVPDVTGMTQADATYLLQNKGFTVRATTVPSDSTEGLVLLMDPGAGARQEEGTEVVIHVSTSRTVPQVVGMTQDAAAKSLSDNGFENVTVETVRSDDDEGTVLSVDPGEGEKAKASTPITLTVAQAYTVPDISGMTYSQAEQAIEDAGLSSTATYSYTESATEGSVLGCEPAAGTKVSSDTVVVISIAKSRASELTAAARSYLGSNTLKASDGSSFTVTSVDSVSYQGNNTVSFTASGRASTSVTVLGQTLSVTGDSKQVSGTVSFDSSNNVTGVSFQ